LTDFLSGILSSEEKQKEVSLGIYGPPNAGKSTLANYMSRD
jgi:hypothetical protein